MALRPLRAEEVIFRVSAEEEDIPIEGNAIASGDDEQDRRDSDEIRRRLAAGDVTAWCVVHVQAEWSGVRASANLGGVSLAPDDLVATFASENGLYDEALQALNARLDEYEAKLEALRVPDDALKHRIARVLQWDLASVESYSLASLRELLPAGKLRDEVTRLIQSGEAIVG